MKGEEITHIVFISGENEEQKKIMKIGKKIRTWNTGILWLGQAFGTKFTFGDRNWRRGTFLLVTVSDKDSRCHVSFCIL